MIAFDSCDREMLTERTTLRGQRTDALIGDFVAFPDGHLERIAYIWNNGWETSGGGSFYLSETGNGWFTGEANRAIEVEHFADSGITRPGHFWFFSHDLWISHNGVECEAPCRVWLCDCLRGEN